MKTTSTTPSTHTPGSWNYDNAAHPEFSLHVYSEADLQRDDPSICAIVDCEEQEANAHLIAAAPELLEAARLVVSRWESVELAEALHTLSAAIAKAESH